jgi:tRNA pseudouridine38-40 synthase
VRTLKLTIAYDGTDFAGWQRQASARTVQALIEDALTPIESRSLVITGAGRTDAGVHANGQVASVSLSSSIPSGELQRALNATLPDDVRILEIAEAAADFNARFDARHKTYQYSLYCGSVMLPQQRRYAWHVPLTLDLEAMNAAAALLLGERDFSAFQAAGSDVKTTVRELVVSEWLLSGPGAEIGPVYRVSGTGFLRHMVRNIVGTLVDVGRGRRPIDAIPEILSSRDRSQAAATAPAHGLTLWSVDY